MKEELPNHLVYSHSVVDFVTVSVETCLFLEHASEYGMEDFIKKSVKILPLLYLKASLLEIPDSVFDDTPERFVTEEDYLFVKEQVERVLGSDDTYLEVMHPDMAYSDTPILSFVSENLADIYQELKDFAANYQLADLDIMNDGLVVCLQTFGEHWGQKLLNALRALHALRYADGFGGEEDDFSFDVKTGKKGKDNFFNYQNDEESDFADLI